VDFAKMKQLTEKHRGLEVVAINIDDKPEEAQAFLSKYNPPGIHLYGGDGLDSPAANHYGLIIFPNLFLVGTDGKVASRSVQVGTLDDELKKFFK
jgi:hypothetical protein